jgi:hypothetical protein
MVHSFLYNLHPSDTVMLNCTELESDLLQLLVCNIFLPVKNKNRKMNTKCIKEIEGCCKWSLSGNVE